MTDAGFFKGTNADQDSRFADKNKKLLKSMKFGDNLNQKIDMTRVNIESIRPWIVKRITELLTFEDDIVCDYVFNQLSEKHPDPKEIQINMTGFLNSKNARIFLTELWDLLLSAMNTPGGVPAVFLDAKKAELAQKQEDEARQRENDARKGDSRQRQSRQDANSKKEETNNLDTKTGSGDRNSPERKNNRRCYTSSSEERRSFTPSPNNENRRCSPIDRRRDTRSRQGQSRHGRMYSRRSSSRDKRHPSRRSPVDREGRYKQDSEEDGRVMSSKRYRRSSSRSYRDRSLRRHRRRSRDRSSSQENIPIKRNRIRRTPEGPICVPKYVVTPPRVTIETVPTRKSSRSSDESSIHSDQQPSADQISKSDKRKNGKIGHNERMRLNDEYDADYVELPPCSSISPPRRGVINDRKLPRIQNRADKNEIQRLSHSIETRYTDRNHSSDRYQSRVNKSNRSRTLQISRSPSSSPPMHTNEILYPEGPPTPPMLKSVVKPVKQSAYKDQSENDSNSSAESSPSDTSSDSDRSENSPSPVKKQHSSERMVVKRIKPPPSKEESKRVVLSNDKHHTEIISTHEGPELPPNLNDLVWKENVVKISPSISSSLSNSSPSSSSSSSYSSGSSSESEKSPVKNRSPIKQQNRRNERQSKNETVKRTTHNHRKIPEEKHKRSRNSGSRTTEEDLLRQRALESLIKRKSSTHEQ